MKALANGEAGSAKAKAVRIAVDVLSLALLVWCVTRLSAQGYNPFIYFRF